MSLKKNSAAAVALAIIAGIGIYAQQYGIPNQGYEGLRLKGYSDIGGTITICYGETNPDSFIVSESDCIRMAKQRVEQIGDAILPSLLTQPDYRTAGAFISLAYNIGVSAFKNSTLVRLYNQGDHIGACAQILRWVYVKGRRITGLVNRRNTEYKICMDGVSNEQHQSADSFVRYSDSLRWNHLLAAYADWGLEYKTTII